MKKLLEYFKKRLEIRKLVSQEVKKKFNPSDYDIKGFTNPYKPDLSSKPKEPTIPMNLKSCYGYTNPAKTFNKNTFPKPKGVPSGSKI